MLKDWERESRYFVKVMPTDYRRALRDKAAIERRAAEFAKGV